MNVYLSCPDAVMPHKLLHYFQVGALLNKMCGKGVAQQNSTPDSRKVNKKIFVVSYS